MANIIKASKMISRIYIRYPDYATRQSTKNLKTLSFKKAEFPGQYSIYNRRKISIDNLSKRNILFSYDPFNGNKCSYTSEHDASENHIIFARNSEKISTGAIYCWSIMLFCKNMKLASGIHISALYANNMNDHSDAKEMFLYGYANLKKLTHNERIIAFICGGAVMFDNDTNVNRDFLDFLLPELIKRDIKVERIDAGGYYSRQELNLKTGKYTVKY
jgi:hypothetical protein